jgi:hypothetical protein
VTYLVAAGLMFALAVLKRRQEKREDTEEREGERG